MSGRFRPRTDESAPVERVPYIDHLQVFPEGFSMNGYPGLQNCLRFAERPRISFEGGRFMRIANTEIVDQRLDGGGRQRARQIRFSFLSDIRLSCSSSPTRLTRVLADSTFSESIPCPRSRTAGPRSRFWFAPSPIGRVGLLPEVPVKRHKMFDDNSLFSVLGYFQTGYGKRE